MAVKRSQVCVKTVWTLTWRRRSTGAVITRPNDNIDVLTLREQVWLVIAQQKSFPGTSPSRRLTGSCRLQIPNTGGTTTGSVGIARGDGAYESPASAY